MKLWFLETNQSESNKSKKDPVEGFTFLSQLATYKLWLEHLKIFFLVSYHCSSRFRIVARVRGTVSHTLTERKSISKMAV